MHIFINIQLKKKQKIMHHFIIIKISNEVNVEDENKNS
jgi:hypothetical protein